MKNSILSRGNNNLNLIRLIAALVVIYAHSYAVTAVGAEPIALLTGVTHSGELSVAIFFFISGMLVTKSLVETNSIWDFFIKRFLRIYPGLIVCCFLVTYVFSWAFNALSFTDVLHSRDAFHYFYTNSLGVWNVHFIPGVYEDHPEKGLNGSLWSITLELRLYFMLGLLALLGVMTDGLTRIITMIGLLIALAINSRLVPLIGTNPQLYGSDPFPAFSIIFLLGGLFYLLEDRLPFFSAKTLFISVLLLILASHTEIFKFSIFAFVIIFSIWLSTRKFIINKLSFTQDYSYGVYLYGWPAEQIAYSLCKNSSIASNSFLITCIAVPLALLLAMVSWHFVERPSMNFGRILISKKSLNRFSYRYANVRVEK